MKVWDRAVRKELRELSMSVMALATLATMQLNVAGASTACTARPVRAGDEYCDDEYKWDAAKDHRIACLARRSQS